MLDFAGSELNMRSVVSQRERDVRATIRHAAFFSAPLGVRSVLAAKLAKIALRLDADTIRSMNTGDPRVAGHHG